MVIHIFADTATGFVGPGREGGHQEGETRVKALFMTHAHEKPHSFLPALSLTPTGFF